MTVKIASYESRAGGGSMVCGEALAYAKKAQNIGLTLNRALFELGH